MSFDSITNEIIEKISEKTESQPDELQPLQEVIDCDALEEVVESSGDVYMEFPYEGYIVEIRAGDVSLGERNPNNRY